MNRPPSSRLPAAANTAPVIATEAVPPPLTGPDLLLVESSLFWSKYKLPIVGAIALLVLALVGSEIYELQREKKVEAAGAELDAAKTPADYRKVLETYPGSTAAANAAILLGRAQLEAKDFAGAAKTWQDFAGQFPQHALAPVALIGAGGAMEAAGRKDEARSLYQRVATSYQNSFAAPLARLDEAALLKAERKPEDARRVYENIMAGDANSDAAQEAAEELRYLRIMPSAPAASAAPNASASPVAH